MSRRHVKSVPAVHLTTAEKLHKRRLKRKLGPSAQRRAAAREHLQPKKEEVLS